MIRVWSDQNLTSFSDLSHNLVLPVNNCAQTDRHTDNHKRSLRGGAYGLMRLQFFPTNMCYKAPKSWRACNFSHADSSRVSILICLCDSVCLSVRTIKPKQLKLKLPNLARDSPSRYLAHQWILGQRSKVKVWVRVRRSSGRREWNSAYADNGHKAMMSFRIVMRH